MYRAKKNSKRKVSLTLCFFSVALSGCVTTNVDEFLKSTTLINNGDGIVVLGRKSTYSHETEDSFVECVSSNLEGLELIDPAEFTDAMYPWMEPYRAPLVVSDVSSLLTNPTVLARIKSVGVRYMIWLDGATKTDESGSMTCSIGPGGGGCFGFLTFEQDSEYEANVWDIESSSVVGRVSSNANGTSYVPGLVVPIPIIAQVQKNACKGIAEQLKGFIQTQDPIARNG